MVGNRRAVSKATRRTAERGFREVVPDSPSNPTLPATARAAPMGVLLDQAAGVIGAADIRAAGALGAIRCVSGRRPGGASMLGTPIRLPEARDLHRSGVTMASCHRFGKQDTHLRAVQTAGRTVSAGRGGGARPSVRRRRHICTG